MRQNYLNFVRISMLCCLILGMAGLTSVKARESSESVVKTITEDATIEEGVIDKLIVDQADSGDQEIVVTLMGNVTIKELEITAKTSVELWFHGSEAYTVSLGVVTNHGSLTLDNPTDIHLTVGEVTNNGRFMDRSGIVQEVKGVAGFKLDKAKGFLVAPEGVPGAFGLYSSVVCPDGLPLGERVEHWSGSEWGTADTEKAPVTTKGLRAADTADSFSACWTGTDWTGGLYRVVWSCEEGEVYTELRSTTVELLRITESKALEKGACPDAILVSGGTAESPLLLTLDEVKVAIPEASDPAYNENLAGLVIDPEANVTILLKGSNSDVSRLVNRGTLRVMNENNIQFEKVNSASPMDIVNEGNFTDETGTISKIYGKTGIWVELLTDGDKVIAPDDTEINTIACTWHIENILSAKETGMEYWNERKQEWTTDFGNASEGEATPAMLKSEKPAFSDNTYYAYYSAARKGQYRVYWKAWNRKDETKITTLYSKPFNLLASVFEITNEHLEIGTAPDEVLDILPALIVSAKGTEEIPAEAILKNVILKTNSSGAPSMEVKPEANVNLTLKGSNDLGYIQVDESAKIVLKLDSERNGTMLGEDDLPIAGVRNGGSFTDETGRVSKVVDLEGHTMIEFTDTLFYKRDNIISVSLHAVGNSLNGGYMVIGKHAEKWNETSKAWETAQIQEPSELRAATESADQSAETTVTLTTTEEGLYRIGVEAKSINDETKNAKLYFMFRLKDVEVYPLVIANSGDVTKPEEPVNILLFRPGESQLDVTLTDMEVSPVAEVPEEYPALTVVEKGGPVNITLKGMNNLGEINVMDGAELTLKAGDTFKVLEATVVNVGKFADETGTIQTVKDNRGLTMLDISKSQKLGENGYALIAKFDFFFGNYEPCALTLQKKQGTEWIDVDGKEKPLTKAGESVVDEGPDGEEAVTWIGLAPGEYRVKVYGEEWIDGIEEGSEQNPHTVTLYSYFTVAEPEPEPVPTYYNVVIPEVEGATTSPAAGTYTEEEGSYFSFTLTLKEGYEQSVPEVKANDAILTPDANGTYTILGIYEDITIAINGVVENTPTANAEVANPEVKVWFADNALHVYAPRKVVLWIYDLQGGLRYAKEEVVGEHTVSLSTGVYIVRVGDRRYKISL